MTYNELREKVKSPDDLYDMLDALRKYKKTWKHRASSSAVFFANPLHYALQQGLGVYFGGNDKTLLGTCVHEGVDYAYKNPSARRGKAIKVLINKGIEEYKNMSEEIRSTINIPKLLKRAIKCFKLYYKEVLLKNLKYFVSSEEYLEVAIPPEMLKNTLNAGKIVLTGTFDRLYKDEDGNYILVDLKTSGSKIYATVDKPKEYQDLEAHKGALLEQVNKHKKVVDKYYKAEEKLKEHQTELAIQQERLNDAKSNNKPFKAISNKITKTESLIVDWNENLRKLKDSQKELSLLDQEYLDVCAKIKPFAIEHAKQIHAARIEEAKKKYSLQVSQYALMYMIEKGIRISKARIEVLFTKEGKEPELEVFEWDLDSKEFAKADFAVNSIISTIEAFYDGVSSRLLFRDNSYSMFYGSETNSFIDSLWQA